MVALVTLAEVKADLNILNSTNDLPSFRAMRACDLFSFVPTV